MSFVRAANPIWLFVDLQGNILDDSYYISFLSNTFPYLPQAVYHDDQGLVPWSNPLQFHPNGTLDSNLFFDPELVYRLEIRQGPTQSDQLIYEINNFVPISGDSPIDTNSGSQENQVSNPQFAFISFVSPLSIAAAGTYEIAPGWFLELTGAGTATVTQLIFDGTQNTDSVTVPPYALRINTSGWTTAILYQRFSGVGAIWSQTFVSMSVLARSSTSSTITLNYAPESPGATIPITSGALSSGTSYLPLTGIAEIVTSTNNNPNDVSYVDMQIVLPNTGIVDISDVQVMGHNENVSVLSSLVLPDETIERQSDHLFHYYSDQLIMKPKDTILVGWNFTVNPWQFSIKTAKTLTNKTMYTADQTIVSQETASSYSTSIASVPNREGFQLTALTSTANRVAIIQYLEPVSILPYWSYKLSSLVMMRIFSPTHSSSVGIKMRLIYRTDLPPVIGNTEPIASWGSPDPIFAAGWTAIAPLNDPTYILPNAYDDGFNTMPAFSFNAFQMPNATTDSMVLGIVLYTVNNMNSGATADSIVIDKISLVPNLFAVETEPQTVSQVLKLCELYYEKSYDSQIQPGTVTDEGALLRLMQPFPTNSSAAVESHPKSFEIPFRTSKAFPPIVTIYSNASGAAGNLHSYIRAPSVSAANNVALATFWNEDAVSNKKVNYLSIAWASTLSTAGADTWPDAFIKFHYTADSRVGAN